MNKLREIIIPFGLGLTAFTISAVVFGVLRYGV
jgi:hypothetical protein